MNIYKCPVCGETLLASERSIACNKGHSFDRAHDNYVNLLPGNRKNSKDPGDSKEMMESRRAFLEKGFYGEFSDRLNEIVFSILVDKWSTILDSGCGEGYYITNLKNAFYALSLCEKETRIHRDMNMNFYGMDISKHAIKYASKRDRKIEFFVGSSFEIPVIDKSVDCVIRNFAPGDNKEFHRILKENGKLIIITPGSEHLYELKAALYEKPRKHEPTKKDIAGFQLVDTQELRYHISIHNNVDIQNLISMTPYYWSIKPETRNHLDQITALTTGLHFVFDIYEKI